MNTGRSQGSRRYTHCRPGRGPSEKEGLGRASRISILRVISVVRRGARCRLPRMRQPFRNPRDVQTKFAKVQDSREYSPADPSFGKLSYPKCLSKVIQIQFPLDLYIITPNLSGSRSQGRGPVSAQRGRPETRGDRTRRPSCTTLTTDGTPAPTSSSTTSPRVLPGPVPESRGPTPDVHTSSYPSGGNDPVVEALRPSRRHRVALDDMVGLGVGGVSVRP